MSAEAHDIKKEVKKYLMVFGALLVLTVITVASAGIEVGVTLGIVMALIIASVKGYLVACNFMHLSSEKSLIYMVLILAAFFFAAMMALIYFGYVDLPQGAEYVS